MVDGNPEWVFPGGRPSADRIVLGGRFGEEPQSLSFQRLDAFTGAGGRLVETAHSYAGGQAEEVVGKWVAANLDSVAVIDKVGHPDEDGHIDLGLHALAREATVSCRRLGTDQIDVLVLHRDDPLRTVDEIAQTLLRLVRVGLAGQVGVSNWRPSRVEALSGLLAAERLRLFASYQMSLAVPVTPLWPGTLHADTAAVRTLQRCAIPLLAWAAHARGYFTGTTDLPRRDMTDPFASLDNDARRVRCVKLARRLGSRPEAVALAWLLHQPLTYPIIGPQTLKELDISLAAAEIQLSDDELRWLRDGDDA